MRHQQRDVETNALLLESCALRRKIGWPATVGIDHHGGDALREHWLTMFQAFGGQSAAGMRMNIDEARRDGHAAGIDFPGPRRSGKRTDCRDPVPDDADISQNPRVAISVVDMRVL